MDIFTRELFIQMGSTMETLNNKSLISIDCHRKLERVRIRHDEEEEEQQQGKHNNTANRKSLTDKLRQVKCWKSSLKALEAYKIQNTSLIHSDETMGIMRWKSWHDMSQPAPCDLIAFKLLQVDWHVVIVVMHRRYWEWIMSSKQHIERYTIKKPRHRNWPSSKQQQDDGGYDFQAPLPIILTVEPGNSSYYPFYYTYTIVNAVPLLSVLLYRHYCQCGSTAFASQNSQSA
jgi:hypothetical protein